MADGTLTVKTRDQWADDYCRFLRMRNPNAKTGPDESDRVDALVLADQLLYCSNDAKVLAGRVSLQDRTGTQLDEVGRPTSEGGLGVPRPGAEGASGALVISTTASGTIITAGSTLRTVAGVAYAVTLAAGDTGERLDGSTFSVVCTEAGPQTNLPAGTKLVWDSPPPGCFANAVVYAQQDGSGLTGGHEEMGDDDYRTLLAEAQANPAGGGNDAEVQRYIQDSRAHGVAVEKAFTYASIAGHASMGFAFTLRGQSVTSSRIPSPDQLNIVADYLLSKMAATDAYIKLQPVADPLKLSFRISWIQNGWTNAVQWPVFRTTDKYQISSASSATVFSIECAGVYNYGSLPDPVVGQVIALYDKTNRRFVRKTIKSISGTGPWTITCDTLANASDLAYLPVVGQWVMPWADGLADIGDLAIAYVRSMGPGEITSIPLRDGVRRRRLPRPNGITWPNRMDGRLAASINSLPSVERVLHVDGADYVTEIGGSFAVALADLVDIGVYPL
jgi:Baseplate J-like protein